MLATLILLSKGTEWQIHYYYYFYNIVIIFFNLATCLSSFPHPEDNFSLSLFKLLSLWNRPFLQTPLRMLPLNLSDVHLSWQCSSPPLPNRSICIRQVGLSLDPKAGTAQLGADLLYDACLEIQSVHAKKKIPHLSFRKMPVRRLGVQA